MLKKRGRKKRIPEGTDSIITHNNLNVNNNTLNPNMTINIVNNNNVNAISEPIQIANDDDN